MASALVGATWEIFDVSPEFHLAAVFVGLAVSLHLFYLWFGCLHLSRCTNRIPGYTTRPILSYWSWLKHIYKNRREAPPLYYILELMCSVCAAFDTQKITSIWVSFRPFVFFYKAETVEVLLNSHVTIDKSKEYTFLHPWLGTGLLTSTGDKWRSRRKLLTPAFHFRILEDFMPIYNEQAQELVDKMKDLVAKPWVDIVPLMTMCTLEIICETTMGVRINAQRDTENEYVKAIYEIGETIIYRALRPWLWLDRMFCLSPTGWKFKKNLSIVHGFTRKVIKEKKDLLLRQRAIQPNNTIKEDITNGYTIHRRRQAFLELLLELHLDDASLTEEDIREEVDTFMFEGHDTTAMALTWALYNIGLRPDVQENIYKELDTIFDGDTTRHVTSDDLKAMKYLDCVLKESLRLYPSVPFIARELKEDIRVLDYTVAPGSLCLIFPLMLHRDSEVFPNPEYFDPDRFLPENCAGRHPYAYIPFSAGPRNCIGQKFAVMEEKTIMATILRNFKIKSLDHRDVIHVIPDLILRNVEPIRIKFTPR